MNLNFKFDDTYDYRAWFKVGLFNSEDSCKKSVPHFFNDAKFEAHTTTQGNKVALWVNKEYWLSK